MKDRLDRCRDENEPGYSGDRARGGVRGGVRYEALCILALIWALLCVLMPGAAPAAVWAREAAPFYLYTTERVFSPQEKPYVMARGTGAGSGAGTPRGLELEFEVYRFDPFTLIEKEKTLSRVGSVTPEDARLVASFSLTPRRRDKSGDFLLKVPFSPPGPGGYLVVARDQRGRKQATWVIVTRLGLVTKQANNALVVYAQDFASGRPFAGVLVRVYDGHTAIASGYTDRNGLLYVGKAGLPRNAVVVARYGPNFAHVNSTYYWEDSRYKVYAYTDRPVYRPGQEVFFKGIAREDTGTGGDYRVLGGEKVLVDIRDAGDASVYRAELVTNEFGAFGGQFTLGREPALGTYRILTTVKGSTQYAWFKVAEYRKPEYQVTVKCPRPTYVAGDRVPVEVSASYYFGAPVAGARVRYYVYSQPYYTYFSPPEEEGYYSYLSDEGMYYGELVTQGEAKTDGGGVARFSVATRKIGRNRRFIIEARVVDESRREVMGRTSVVVARGTFEIALRPERYVLKPRERVEIKVRTEDLEGKPVAQRLETRVYRVEWQGKVMRRWEAMSVRVATGRDGRGGFTFLPREEGSYEIEIRGSDERGNVIATTELIWVTGEEYVLDSYGGPELDIVTDKVSYDRNDVARVVVNTTQKDVFALVTIEGYRLYSAEVVHLAGHSRVFEIPLRREYSPNIYFGVTLVAGKRLISREKAIYISPREKFLNVTIKPDKDTYGPGEEATYTIKATDSAGKPVRAELSFGLVDASVYAVQGEMAPDIRRFFYGARANRVVTNYSFPEWYYGGADKDAGAGETRKWFPDTAAWEPFVITDGRGNARLKVRLPDSLTTWRATVRAHTLDTSVGSGTCDIRASKEFFVRVATPRFLTQGDETVISTIVHNYTSRSIQAKVSLEVSGSGVEIGAVREAGGASAGSGGGKGKGEGEEGAATARGAAMAKGVRAGAGAGAGARVVSVAPGGAGRVDWRVKANGVGNAMLVARAVAGRDSDAMQVSLPVRPCGVERREAVAGEIAGSRGAGGAGSAAGARAGEEAGAGGGAPLGSTWRPTAGPAQIEFKLPSDVIPGTANLEIRLSPSMGGAVFGALDYLASYPYGCVEQTMSSFLPDIVAARALSDLGASDPELEKSLPRMVNDGLQRLYRFQHYDGGWGWWEHDETDTRMTAYVVWGLALARQAGFQVDQRVIDRGKKALYEALMKPSCLDELVYTHYALTQAGAREPELIRLDEALARRDELTNLSRALLAMTLKGLGREADAGRVLEDLRRSARESATACYWESRGRGLQVEDESDEDDLWQDNKVETTAYVLRAFMAVRPEDALVPKAARWLMNVRQGNRWASTKDTAAAALALLEFLKVKGNLAPRFSARVYVDGRMVGELTFTGGDVFAGEKVVRLDGLDVHPGRPVRVGIEKAGEGKLYYAAAMEFYVPAPRGTGTGTVTGTGDVASRATGDEGGIAGGRAAGIEVVRGYFTREVHERRDPGGESRGDKGYTYTYKPLRGPVRAGDEVFVRLLIKADRPYRYMMIEDAIPSGFEVVDDYIDSYSWDFWYGRKEVRDAKVAFASSYLRKGANEIIYSLRAERPGRYRVAPTNVWCMYDPEITAVAGASEIAVEEAGGHALTE
ncbi:MAG: hypothetical protein HPY71_11440 [Firmicutes bacterium]|nr:hypothetical protein [Bacillota bacterium]